MLYSSLLLPLGHIHEDDQADDEELRVSIPVKTKPKVSFSDQVDGTSFTDKPTDESKETVPEIHTSEQEDYQIKWASSLLMPQSSRETSHPSSLLLTWYKTLLSLKGPWSIQFWAYRWIVMYFRFNLYVTDKKDTDASIL